VPHPAKLLNEAGCVLSARVGGFVQYSLQRRTAFPNSIGHPVQLWVRSSGRSPGSSCAVTV